MKRLDFSQQTGPKGGVACKIEVCNLDSIKPNFHWCRTEHLFSMSFLAQLWSKAMALLVLDEWKRLLFFERGVIVVGRIWVAAEAAPISKPTGSMTAASYSSTTIGTEHPASHLASLRIHRYFNAETTPRPQNVIPEGLDRAQPPSVTRALTSSRLRHRSHLFWPSRLCRSWTVS